MNVHASYRPIVKLVCSI